MFHKELKKLWKFFIFLFLISFLAVNWIEVSWIFNYRVVSGFFSDFFKGKERQAQLEPTSLNNNEEFDFNFYEKENSLEISKIDISVPLIFLSEANIDEVSQALNRGVVIFPGSALPGQKGQTIILGHSAPPGWPKIKYDWVFSRLNDLVQEDKITLFFKNRKYEYFVTGKVFLEKGEELSEQELTKNENVLILISCWPPGKDIRRIAVEAVIK